MCVCVKCRERKIKNIGIVVLFYSILFYYYFCTAYASNCCLCRIRLRGASRAIADNGQHWRSQRRRDCARRCAWRNWHSVSRRSCATTRSFNVCSNRQVLAQRAARLQRCVVASLCAVDDDCDRRSWTTFVVCRPALSVRGNGFDSRSKSSVSCVGCRCLSSITRWINSISWSIYFLKKKK